MKYFFSHEGYPAMKRLAADDKVLVGLDFDGTLAPIVQDPPRAQMSVPIAHELERLCAVTPVAIISGRELGDLEQRITVRAAYLIGNHGNEGLAAVTVDGGACRKICAEWTKQLRRMPESRADDVFIEPKRYMVSVHYRLANDHLATQQKLSRLFGRLKPAPRVVHGKCVFDLIPPGAVCKDDTMSLLATQTQADVVLYVGDDECDELVFASAQPDWITVRVGYWSHSAAKYYLRCQREVSDLLLLLNLRLGLAASNSP
ncbi:Trehalose 6-phosphate phosphatase [Georgfuchsia toluolica]|uniref:Trehalose 6-phosphate phosphatase n=1 Tax=Georgfuchsia toluolica TaxID=424218 RepID=A0A916J2V5_9PROT|nr:trehalose-phosphatase [Georgfuchsia toluolica]CAG4882384.1 Trehalose 6-phosphate phosphatase [Georgfuchsia toluolica]